jgi:hypothetical protein
MAWCLRFTLLVNDAFQIVVDMGFPAMCQVLFLGLVFYTVPKWKMGWVKFFFILRTIFSIGYIILGVAGLYHGVAVASEWGYWKAGIAEAIVFFGSLGVIYELKDDSLPDIESRAIPTKN